MTAPSPIGGFFGRHDGPSCEPGQGLLARWTAGLPFAAFVNARSALAALADHQDGARVWTPGFLCREALAGIDGRRIGFYALTERFQPDLAAIDMAARHGDIVLLVAYFGRPFSAEVMDWAANHTRVTVVEDHAQALDAPSAEGSWRLYSPRKLLGVADGGLLVAPEDEDVPPQPTGAADAAALWRAPDLRGADAAGLNNAVWHAANQAKEAAMSAARSAITPLSLSILAAASPAGLAQARLDNWLSLDGALQDWAAFVDPGPAPFGYVLRLEPKLRDRLLAALHAERIFAAVHWREIAAPADQQKLAHVWSRELITLPCDHRYGPADMQRVADAVMRVLA